MRARCGFNILILLVFLTSGGGRKTYAATITQGGNLNFGVIMQNSPNSFVAISTDGSVNTGGIYLQKESGNTTAFTLASEARNSTGFYERIDFNQNVTKSIEWTRAPVGCDVNLSNIIALPTSATGSNDTEYTYLLKRAGGLCSGFETSVSFKVYATLNITGYCEVSDTPYSGKIKISFDSKECRTGTYGLSCNTSNGSCPYSDGFNRVQDVSVDFSFTVQLPLDVTEIQPMHFGSILPRGAGTITVSPDGSFTNTDTLIVLDKKGVSAGVFQVIGIGSRPIYIDIDGSSILNGPGEAMVIDEFTPEANSIELNGSQDDLEAKGNFAVGATLHVNQNQVAGSYSGTYNVIVSY